ncbi:MAG: presenilin family intramembrane aspartyl protease [archaeon]
MKHNLRITFILISMFLITQFIGLAVQHADVFHMQAEVNGTLQTVSNPQLEWIQPPEVKTQGESFSMLGSLIFAFVIAISLLFFLSRFKVEFILKAWFFIVVVVALFLCFYAFEILVPFVIPPAAAVIIPLVLALPLAYIKIFKREFLIHNFTELLIYPGIAAVFVPILNIWTIIIFLILISIYDMWAVWHSGIMQKMAKYQINKLNIFSGFFVPYVGKKMRMKIKNMKKTLSKSQLKKKKIRVNVAILGGGDVIFPIMAAGVMLKTFGLGSALFVIFGATAGLLYLFMRSEKKKFYPAMPFISAGIFAGMVLSWLVL